MMSKHRRSGLVRGFAGLALAVSATYAFGSCDDPLHVDVEMQADLVGPALLVGSGDFCDGDFVPDFSVRVFSAEFIDNPGLPAFFQGRAFNPGFNAGGGAFPAFTPVGFNIVGPLRKWDDAVGDFATIPEETLSIQTANGSATTPTEEGVEVVGPAITASDDVGSFHVHPTFALGEPKSPGVYLLTLEMTASSIGVPASDRIYIVFDMSSDPLTVDDAVEYVETVIAVPDPVCVGDLNGDLSVDAIDLGILLAAFGTSEGGDLNGDAVTDAIDLGVLLANFGSACE